MCDTSLQVEGNIYRVRVRVRVSKDLIFDCENANTPLHSIAQHVRVRVSKCVTLLKGENENRYRVWVSKCVTLLKGEHENRYRDKAVEAVSEARACRKSL